MAGDISSRRIVGPDLYVDWRRSDLGAITEAVEDRVLFALLGPLAGRAVLEVGCGEGALAVKLCRAGASVAAVDPNPAMIAQARIGTAESGFDVSLAVAAGEQLPFGDASFDVVLAKTVLCFVEEGDAMIAEMARVLRPGGCFVIGELGRWSTWAAQRRVRAWLGSTLWRRGRFRTAGELRRAAGDAGLRVDAVRGAVFYPRWTWAARLVAAHEDRLGRRTTFGAAFIALAASKP